jgi:hypothetical protein
MDLHAALTRPTPTSSSNVRHETITASFFRALVALLACGATWRTRLSAEALSSAVLARPPPLLTHADAVLGAEQPRPTACVSQLPLSHVVASLPSTDSAPAADAVDAAAGDEGEANAAAVAAALLSQRTLTPAQSLALLLAVESLPVGPPPELLTYSHAAAAAATAAATATAKTAALGATAAAASTATLVPRVGSADDLLRCGLLPAFWRFRLSACVNDGDDAVTTAAGGLACDAPVPVPSTAAPASGSAAAPTIAPAALAVSALETAVRARNTGAVAALSAAGAEAAQKVAFSSGSSSGAGAESVLALALRLDADIDLHALTNGADTGADGDADTESESDGDVTGGDALLTALQLGRAAALLAHRRVAFAKFFGPAVSAALPAFARACVADCLFPSGFSAPAAAAADAPAAASTVSDIAAVLSVAPAAALGAPALSRYFFAAPDDESQAALDAAAYSLSAALRAGDESHPTSAAAPARGLDAAGSDADADAGARRRRRGARHLTRALAMLTVAPPSERMSSPLTGADKSGALSVALAAPAMAVSGSPGSAGGRGGRGSDDGSDDMEGACDPLSIFDAPPAPLEQLRLTLAALVGDPGLTVTRDGRLRPGPGIATADDGDGDGAAAAATAATAAVGDAGGGAGGGAWLRELVADMGGAAAVRDYYTGLSDRGRSTDATSAAAPGVATAAGAAEPTEAAVAAVAAAAAAAEAGDHTDRAADAAEAEDEFWAELRRSADRDVAAGPLFQYLCDTAQLEKEVVADAHADVDADAGAATGAEAVAGAQGLSEGPETVRTEIRPRPREITPHAEAITPAPHVSASAPVPAHSAHNELASAGTADSVADGDVGYECEGVDEDRESLYSDEDGPFTDEDEDEDDDWIVNTHVSDAKNAFNPFRPAAAPSSTASAAAQTVAATDAAFGAGPVRAPTGAGPAHAAAAHSSSSSSSGSNGSIKSSVSVVRLGSGTGAVAVAVDDDAPIGSVARGLTSDAAAALYASVLAGYRARHAPSSSGGGGGGRGVSTGTDGGPEPEPEPESGVSAGPESGAGDGSGVDASGDVVRDARGGIEVAVGSLLARMEAGEDVFTNNVDE